MIEIVTRHTLSMIRIADPSTPVIGTQTNRQDEPRTESHGGAGRVQQHVVEGLGVEACVLDLHVCACFCL